MKRTDKGSTGNQQNKVQKRITITLDGFGHKNNGRDTDYKKNFRRRIEEDQKVHGQIKLTSNREERKEKI